MTYRNDLDALAAREAALAKELEAKRAERDEVGRLLAEAKAQEAKEVRAEDIRSGKRMARRPMIGLAFGYVMMVTAALVLQGEPEADSIHVTDYGHGEGAPARDVYTCDEIKPDYDRANAQTAQAYAAALAQQGLVPANLEEVQLGGGWSSGPMTREELDKPLGVSPEPWTVIDYEHHGTKRRALAGEVIEASYMPGPAPIELVADAHGAIWKVVRVPRVRNVKSVDVDACPGWGCFGSPPAGAMPPPILSRTLYLMPVGATYRGTIEISYDAPQILMNNIKDDPLGACSPPG